MSIESFYGYIGSPIDAGLLIHCSTDGSGRIPSVKRRLVAKERAAISSGSCFVFCERESGMRRWTDGMRWSKSRVEGQFLVYRRVEHDGEQEDNQFKRRRQISIDSSLDEISNNCVHDRFALSNDLNVPLSDATYFGRDSSLSFDDNVLCKKTFAISIGGSVSHVICYYSKIDLALRKLQCPTTMPLFADIILPDDFVDTSNFRLHPKGGISNSATTSISSYHMITPRSSPAIPDLPVFDSCKERFVTVHRISEPQSLRINLSNEYSVEIVNKDFRRIIMHAFNFELNDNVQISSQDCLLINNQESYSELKYGDVIQVRNGNIKPSKEELAWLDAVRIRVEERKNVLESVALDMYTKIPEAIEETNEAAKALAALAGHCDETQNVEALPSTTSVM